MSGGTTCRMVFSMEPTQTQADIPTQTPDPTPDNPAREPDVIDLSIIEPIPNAGDLADHDVARSLADMAYSLVSGDSPDGLDEFLSRTEDPDVLNVAADFGDWAAAWMDEGFEGDPDRVQTFVSETAAELLDQIWPAYDPDDLVPDTIKADAALSFVGASLFWGFMADAEIVTDDQAHAWSSLWFSIIVDPHIRAVYEPVPSDVLEPGEPAVEQDQASPPVGSVSDMLTTEPPVDTGSDW